MRIKNLKKIKKQRQKLIKVKEVKKNYETLEYRIYEKIPNDLKVTQEHKGKVVEVAGYKPNNFFKIYDVRDDHILLIDENGQFRAFSEDMVMLHRNIKKREATRNINDIYNERVAKRLKKKDKKR